MSEPKLIGQIIAEMAADPNNQVWCTLRQCPCIQAILDSYPNLVIPISEGSTNGLKDWLDNQDVMQALHISCRTLQTLRSNGTLPYSRINNKIYYRRQDIEKILDDNYSRKNPKRHGNED